MLATQRPRMGSTQPTELPFGYSINSDQEFFQHPPEPPAGAPLLSDNDTRLLSTFFEDITAENYNLTSFGEGLNFSDSWMALPPQLMGTATSFGQHPAATFTSDAGHSIPVSSDFIDAMTFASPTMAPPPPTLTRVSHTHLEQQPSADVLAAATLLQSGAVGRSGNAGHGAAYASRDTPRSQRCSVGDIRHQTMADFKQDGRRSLGQADNPNEHDNTFADMYFGPADRPGIPGRMNPPDVQWGSDSSFGRGERYVPRSEKETYEHMESEKFKIMQCLEVNRSAGNTRPASPAHHELSPVKGHSRKSSDLASRVDDPGGPPRKRRKSKAGRAEPDDDDDDSAPTPKASRRRKTKNDAAPTMSNPPQAENGAPIRRRKSANGAKPPRENLSEEQKRENHIRSEQKRRTIIKEGFDDLCDIVPGLKGGGFSKSTMLSMAAEWLEDLLRGNEKLAAQLARAEGQL